MKKTKITFALLLGLIIVIGMNSAILVKGNPKPYMIPTITIFSPIQDQTYHTSNILLNVSLDRTNAPFDVINSLNYSLDGQKDKPLPYQISSGIYCKGKITLYNLSEGIHTILVHSETKHDSEIIPFNTTVSFTIETTIKPVIKQFPTNPVVASSLVIIAITSACLLVYFKRRKSKMKSLELGIG